MKRFTKILCVVEPDSSSKDALIHAATIANDNQAELTIATVVKKPKFASKILKSASEMEKLLDQTAALKRSAVASWCAEVCPNLNSTIEVFTGIKFIQVIQQVLVNNYDLVIKNADTYDWKDRLFVSEDMHLLRKCPCPVLILKPGADSPFRSVLATVDVMEDPSDKEEYQVQQQLNSQVLQYASLFALTELTEFHVGSVWEAFGEEFLRYSAFSDMKEGAVDQYVEEARAECASKLAALVDEMKSLIGADAFNYLKPKTHIEKGVPEKEIPEMTQKYAIDLVVMGTVARTGIPGFIIGNTAESILGQLQCSVLAVKPQGFISPVSAETTTKSTD